MQAGARVIFVPDMYQFIGSLYRWRKRLLTHSVWSVALKAGVAVLLLLVLYLDLSRRDHLPDMWAAFRTHLSGAEGWWLALACLLMPLNWLAETEKWRQFVHRHEPFPRGKALLAVFTGVCFSLFTPNRVGEYGGRLLYVPAAHQWRAVVANLVGNYCQYLVLMGMGALGSAWILAHFDVVDRGAGSALIALAAVVFGGMLWLYFRFEIVIELIKRHFPTCAQWPVWRRFRMEVLLEFTHRERRSILYWAFLRYGLYTLQYWMLLCFFGIEPGIINALAGISGLFLLQTSIPLPPLAGLVARGNLAVALWAEFGANELSALAATFTLWVINLVIPALIGTFSLFYVNITKSLGYENANTPEHPEMAAPDSRLPDHLA